MKRLYYLGIILLLAFEVANVYFIMPMPGSQEMISIGLAYFLHRWRWVFRAVAMVLLLIGARDAWKGKKWLVAPTTALVLLLVGLINFKMAADKMFLQPTQLIKKDAQSNAVPAEKLVLGIAYKGEARAYPIQLIAYHHQVLDTIGGKAFMVTYCSVCRSGRVFEPVVGGKQEQFRLVGMDHFNAMFEDVGTGSWWRQATGEAIAGTLEGQSLPEWPSLQTSLGTWISLHPNSLVMQPDPVFAAEYAGLEHFESGKDKGGLTGTDTTEGAAKSWVVGIAIGGKAKAFPWSALRKSRLIQAEVGRKAILLALASDDRSFFAYERPDSSVTITIQGDSIFVDGNSYSIGGKSRNGGTDLKRIQAYQEFLHSWQTFHPETE